MQRNEQRSTNLLATLAGMPWWGGLFLAFLGFVMLHPFAIMDVAAAGLDESVGVTSKHFWRDIFATVQYIVPLILLFAPGIAALIQRLRGRAA